MKTDKTDAYYYLTPTTHRAWHKISIDAGLSKHETMERLLRNCIPDKYFEGEVPEYAPQPVRGSGKSQRIHTMLSPEVQWAVIRLAVAGATNVSEVVERCLKREIPAWYFTEKINLEVQECEL